MDTLDPVRYAMSHETPRQPQSAGAASPTRPRAAQEGPDSVGHRGAAGLRPELGVPVEEYLPAGGTQRLGAQADSGPTAQALPTPTTTPRTLTAAGSPGRWVSHRPVDHPAGRRGDSPAVSGVLSSPLHLGGAARSGLELSEARAPSPPTQRAGHRLLATGRLAAYKKRLHGWTLTSSSSTRVASRSPRPSNAPGPRRGTRRRSTIGSSAISSRPSAPSRSLPSTATWHSISAWLPTGPLTAWMSGPSSKPCCAISEARWCCSGIAERSIRAARSKRIWPISRESIPTTSHPMRRNSTRLSISGTGPMPRWPMGRRRMWTSSGADSARPSVRCAAPNGGCGPASMRPNFRGIGESIHYLHVTQ